MTCKQRYLFCDGLPRRTRRKRPGVPASPTFQADVTCTFVAEKKGFKNSQAIKVLGKVHVLDIGIPSSLINRILNRSQ